MRAGTLLFAGGALSLLIALLLSLLLGAVAMPSYLATWLFWASVPIGALPILMLLDLAGPGTDFGLAPTLRGLLWLVPLAAVLMIPVLLLPHSLFGWSMGRGFDTPFGGAWMSHSAFIARSIVYFVIWSVLALAFLRPPSPAREGGRRGVAAIGLFVHLFTVTLASVDWAMATEPNWISPEFGLIVLAAQATIAVSVAVLLAGNVWRQTNPDFAATILLTAAGMWIFLHFMQYPDHMVGQQADRNRVVSAPHRSGQRNHSLGGGLCRFDSSAVGVAVAEATPATHGGIRHGRPDSAGPSAGYALAGHAVTAASLHHLRHGCSAVCRVWRHHAWRVHLAAPLVTHGGPACLSRGNHAGCGPVG